MFINTKAEAKIASTIAHKYGFTVLTVRSFYKRYTTNTFHSWSTQQDARDAQAEIAEAIRAHRNPEC